MYVTDAIPGFRRRRVRGKTFRYLDAEGRPVRDPATLTRIRKLAIPPAWTDVWICPHPEGHIQATGRDARGRKQYRYHADWRAERDAAKYARMSEFAGLLPRARARMARDLARPGLPREKVLAAVVSLMERTMIRVGCAEYARDNATFGLCTLRSDHVSVRGAWILFRFRGKSGREHEVKVADPALAKIVRRCLELPGHEVFCWMADDDRVVDVASSDVNAYLREICGAEVSAKDFRTWGGTVHAFRALADGAAPPSERAANRAVIDAVRSVSAVLGNTPTVCRKYYVHPAILEAYRDGSLFTIATDKRAHASRGLSRDEACVLRLLEPTRTARVAA